MGNLDLRLHYFTEAHYELHRKVTQRVSVDDDNVAKRLSGSAFTLSADASRYVLDRLGHAYFDYRIDVITPQQLPYTGDRYLSLSNERYISNELNADFIDQLSKLRSEEVQELVRWMRAHEQERWYLVGLVDVAIAGIPCNNINFELSLSPYVFAAER